MRIWLREIREKNNLSQYKVAKMADISQSYYGGIETGDRGKQLPVETAKKIAAVLEFDWTLFFEDENDKKIG
jgi:transcriptional regulator with XRE-family HTH domain